MTILIVTNNNILGKGLSIELEDLGFASSFSNEFEEGYDFYVADADSCKFKKNENCITFSLTEGKGDLKRPFLPGELVSLLKKKYNTPDLPSVGAAHNDHMFDTSELSDTESRLLEILLEHRGNAVSAEELSKRVWGRDCVKTNIVNVYIRYLRQKLEKNSDRRIIFTVRGQGYKIK